MNAVIARQSSVAQAGLKLDDLQVGKTASSSAVTSPEVGQAIKNAVDSWHKEYSTKPGYRSGSTYAPEQMRETIEVSSALQLPAILAKLHGPDAHNVRLQFPQPASGNEEERAAIRAEQVAIHKFLQTSHGKDLGELLQEVKGLIENSASFKRDKESGLLPPEMTADLWIRASVGEKLEQIARLPQKLDVSDVVEIGAKKIETVRGALEVALAEAVEQKRGLIITIPKNTDKADQLRSALKQFVEERSAKEGFSQESLAQVKIWIGPTKRSIDEGPQAGAPCRNVREISLIDFLKNEAVEAKAAETSRKTAKKKSDDESISEKGPPSSAETQSLPAESVSITSEASVSSVAVTPAADKDLYWSELVLPPSYPHFSVTTLDPDKTHSSTSDS